MSYYSWEGGQRTTRNRLDALIDFYEKQSPAAGKRIEVNVTPLALCRALGDEFERDGSGRIVERNEFQYRNRTIVAVGKPDPR